MGATGVAVAAGLVAAGVALSNRRTREKMGKSLQKGFKTVGEIAGERFEMGEKGGVSVKSKPVKKATKTVGKLKTKTGRPQQVATHQISIKTKKSGRPPGKRASP